MTELDRRATIQHAPLAEGVTLATLHAAKGLEWECVFIVGAHEGTLPISYAQTPAQVEEERRLFYVGVTRAKEQLSISWSTSRSPGGRASRGPTRFLDPIGVRGLARSGEREQSPRARASGRAVGPADPEVPGLRPRPARRRAPASSAAARTARRRWTRPLYDALLEWRAERAAEEIDAGVRDLHRRHPDRDRGGPPHRRAGTAPHRRASAAPSSTKYGESVLKICTR